MKKFAVFLALAFLVSLAFSSPREGYYGNSYARLSYVKGDVFVQRSQDLGYEEGTVNLPLVQGDKLGTQEGQAEVHFGKRNYLRLNRFAQVDLVDLPQQGNDQIKIHVLAGEVFLRINLLELEKGFEVHTPDASFYIVEEGLYRFDVRENKETELSVYEGSAEGAGEEGSVLIERRERLIAANGYFQSDPFYFQAGYEDSFASWNRSRDALLNRVVARRYLPSELYEYETELAYNGRWVYERPYGYVWVPHVIHYDWRPYFYGRWIWYPIIGWTWVSYDPWGWCVHHYGRWHWRLGLGWYWIPTRYWSPAWVHWYRGYDYYAWCPLSYYGHPVVIINNRFYGRYYDRYYPHHSRALTVVHKRQLQARRVSEVALSRKKIAQLGKINLSSKQPSVKSALNRSQILNSKAAKTFSRANIRPVKKGYLSPKTSNSFSRSKSVRSPSSRQISIRPSPSTPTKTRSIKSRVSSNTQSPVKVYRRSSDLKANERPMTRGVSSRYQQMPQSDVRIKSYTSKYRNVTSYRSKITPSHQSRPRPSVSPSSKSTRSTQYSRTRNWPSSKRSVSKSPRSVTSSYPSRGYVRGRSSYIRDTYSSRVTTKIGSQGQTPSRSRYSSSSSYYSNRSSSRQYVKDRSSSRYTSPSRSRISSSRSSSSGRLSRPSSRQSYKSSSSRRSVSSSRTSSKRLRKK